MEFHEVCYFRVGLDFFSCLRILSPRGAVPRWSSSSSSSWVSLMLRRVASFLVADEALSVPDVFCPVIWGEVDFVYVHSVWVNL